MDESMQRQYDALVEHARNLEQKNSELSKALEAEKQRNEAAVGTLLAVLLLVIDHNK